MVLTVVILAVAILGVYGAYGYRTTQDIRSRLQAITLKMDKLVAEEELKKIRRISVLPKASRDEMVASDYQAWYEEQRLLRQIDPHSLNVDPDWDQISLDDKPLVAGL